MQGYDILIFNQAGHLSLSVAGQHCSAPSAIRLAKLYCQAHESVEVWGGKGRIFALAPYRSSPPPGAYSALQRMDRGP